MTQAILTLSVEGTLTLVHVYAHKSTAVVPATSDLVNEKEAQ